MIMDITTQLANALEVEKIDIRDIKAARDGGYNVVLKDYRKFRNVQPQEEEKKKFVRERSPAPRDANLVPGTEMYIPEDLQAVYIRPRRATIVQLRALCDLLGLEPQKRLRKGEIVKLINEWKVEHAP
jgi:hypothetical protein